MDLSSLGKIRAQIDRIDDEILSLLNRRAILAREAGEIKSQVGEKIFDPVREKEILTRLRGLNKGPLSERAVEEIFQVVLRECRSLEFPLRVAYLGPEGTFSHQAVRLWFGKGEEIPVGDLEEIGEKILKKSADYGILPVENSTEGFIGASFDLLNFYPLKIFLELRMEIHLYLVSSVPLSKVRRIYSHPQPFSQAQRWLRRYTPSAEKIPTSSTAQAFLSLKEDREGGAIVSPFLLEEGGKEYPFVYGPVEDSPRNTTRFWVVGENSKEKETPKGGNSSFRRHNLKTTLFFVLPHRPGTLSKVLRLFSDHRLNLTSIFSRPIPDAEWEYRFFVDVEGDFPVSSKKFLSLLRRRVVHFRVLGVYPSVDLPSPKISREVLSVKEKDL